MSELKGRILYVTECKMNGNGIDLVVEQQIKALLANHYSVELVSRGRLDLPGVTNRYWPLPPSKFLSWLPSKDYYAANSRCFSWLGARYADRRRHDLVIAWTHTAHALFRRAREQGIPCVMNAAGPHRLFNPRALAGLRWPRLPLATTLEEYQLATRILVASDFATQTFVDHGVPGEKLRTIYRGVDLSRFQPRPGKPARPFIVSCCGLLGDRKGSYQLLAAWRELALPDAELWFIGHVPDNEAAQLHAAASPGVRFLGFRKDLPDLLPQAHLHVLLSRSEGFAKVLLEAAACGLPNLCTVESGIPVDMPGTILIQSRDDIPRIKDAIRAGYDNPETVIAQGLAARDAALARFTWDAFGERVVSAIDEILEPK